MAPLRAPAFSGADQLLPTGHPAAAGAMVVLLWRMCEGGSWQLEVSPCATAQRLQSLPRVEPKRIPEGWKPAGGLDGYFQSCETTRGRLGHLAPVVRMSRTQPVWGLPPLDQGADQPRWQTRWGMEWRRRQIR